MIHYNAYFDLKPGVVEAEGLQVVQTFLAGLVETKRLDGFRLLKNQAQPDKSRLPAYQALLEFTDSAQFQGTFAGQRSAGIHAGLHGAVINTVTSFHVEVFQEIR